MHHSCYDDCILNSQNNQHKETSMKKFAKKIIAMFLKELMVKIKSDEFETKLAQKFASATNLPQMTEAEEVAFFKTMVDGCTDAIAEVMGGEAD